MAGFFGLINKHRFKLMKTIFSALLVCLSFSAFAGEDSDKFRALYEKEWNFRLNEFPSLARRNGETETARPMANVSEKDQLRRYEFHKQIKQDRFVMMITPTFLFRAWRQLSVLGQEGIGIKFAIIVIGSGYGPLSDGIQLSPDSNQIPFNQ